MRLLWCMVLYGQWALRLCTWLPKLVLQQCLFHLGRFQPLLWKIQNVTSLVVAHDVWVDDCLVGGRISPGYHCAGESLLPPKTYSAGGADVPRSQQFTLIAAGDLSNRKFGVFSSPQWYKLDVDSGWTTAGPQGIHQIPSRNASARSIPRLSGRVLTEFKVMHKHIFRLKKE